MKDKLIVFGIILAIILAVTLSFVAVSKNSTTTKEITAGAVSGPDLGSYAKIGGVVLRGSYTNQLNQATTTVCAIQSPVATSTLVMGSVQLSVSSTTASTVTIARATTPFATTTSLGSSVIGANAQGYLVASTTGNHIFPPSTYLVVGMAGGVGTFSPTGECSALFSEI